MFYNERSEISVLSMWLQNNMTSRDDEIVVKKLQSLSLAKNVISLEGMRTTIKGNKSGLSGLARTSELSKSTDVSVSGSRGDKNKA